LAGDACGLVCCCSEQHIGSWGVKAQGFLQHGVEVFVLL
jgi:hypothetical protein